MQTARYPSLPLRRIVGRLTYYSPELPPFPAGYFIEPTIVLDCGHQDRDRHQKARAYCWKCGEEARTGEPYDRGTGS